jgi:hypothetical protein
MLGPLERASLRGFLQNFVSTLITSVMFVESRPTPPAAWSAILNFRIRFREIYFVVMESRISEAAFAGTAIAHGLDTKRVAVCGFLGFPKGKNIQERKNNELYSVWVKDE